MGQCKATFIEAGRRSATIDDQIAEVCLGLAWAHFVPGADWLKRVLSRDSYQNENAAEVGRMQAGRTRADS